MQYWTVTDIEQTTVFFTHLGMMLMHGVTRCTNIYNYLHYCAVASINFDWHFPVHRYYRNLPVRMDCYRKASWELLVGLHWYETSHGQSQRPQFLQLGFQIRTEIGWFPGSSDHGSNKFLHWLEPSLLISIEFYSTVRFVCLDVSYIGVALAAVTGWLVFEPRARNRNLLVSLAGSPYS